MNSEKKVLSMNLGGSSDESALEDALKDLMAKLKINQQNEGDNRKTSQQVIKDFIESGAVK